MPSVERPGKKGIYIELDLELLANAQAFATDRGEKFAHMVAEALRRHMAYPSPPRPILPPSQLPDTEVSTPRKGKKKR
jgi:hypothetical protein